MVNEERSTGLSLSRRMFRSQSAIRGDLMSIPMLLIAASQSLEYTAPFLVQPANVQVPPGLRSC